MMISTTSRAILRFVSAPAAFFLLAVLVMFLRHPGLVSQAAFWGEDGWVWFPCAYDHGLACLIEPHTGYLQTFPRLVAALALLAPLDDAPRVFAVLALLVQVAPAVFLVSGRMAGPIPSSEVRLALAVFLLCMPANFETFANATNSQWHLGLLSFLILISDAPTSRAGRGVEAAVLLLNGLSGPFTLLLMPIAAWEFWRRRDGWSGCRLGLLGVTTMIQLGCILTTAAATRTPTPLGAGPMELLTILGRQIAFGGVLGLRAMGLLLRLEVMVGSTLPSIVMGAGCLALLAVAMWYAPRPLRQFALLAACILVAALASPVVSLTEPQWHAMARPGGGARYFLMAILVWFAALVTLAIRAPVVPRRIAQGLLVATLAGVAGDWRYPMVRDEAARFSVQAAAFSTAQAGARVDFPIRPRGSVMTLVKRGE